jgi:hypothetical protein
VAQSAGPGFGLRWADRRPADRGTPPASIAIETDDIRRTVEELKARGVEFDPEDLLVLQPRWAIR